MGTRLSQPLEFGGRPGRCLVHFPSMQASAAFSRRRMPCVWKSPTDPALGFLDFPAASCGSYVQPGNSMIE
jgi:hypothetical protein